LEQRKPSISPVIITDPPQEKEELFQSAGQLVAGTKRIIAAGG